MEKQYINDNKFYIILAIAILALVIGTVGLIISLQRPNIQSLSPEDTNIVKQRPSGSAGDVESTIDRPYTDHGVVESPKKN